MKTKSKTVKSSRALTLSWALVINILISSCSSDEPEPVVFEITEGDAAEFVAVVLSVETYGLAANAVRFSEDIALILTCNTQSRDAGMFSDMSTDGTITYDYSFDETYGYSCDEFGGKVHYSFIAEQELSSLRSEIDSKISGIWTLENIDSEEETYSLAGVYSRNSNRDSKTDELPSAFISTQIDFENLSIDKHTGYFTDGVADFELSGNQVGVDGQAYQGTIDFSNPEETIVMFEGGGAYSLNLLTGEIIKLS